ncbi:MAG: leucine-rich repeat domain-containing protein [Clostridia bacterium]|nr:leucine-rich repeat domain-containing protein [Clostridia bacterium]
MKKKFYLMLAIMVMLVCALAVNVSAEAVHNDNTVDYDATVTLSDGTVCELFDSEGNALIWYIDANSETGYSSIRADSSTVGGPYVEYTTNWSGGTHGATAYQVKTVSITDANGNSFDNKQIVVFNIMDDDVLTNGGETGKPVNCLSETFNGSTNLQYAYLRLDTVNIFANAFKNCTNLKYVNLAEIPALLGIDGASAFEGCTSLFNGEILDLTKTSLVQIGTTGSSSGGTFKGVLFKGIVLPDTVTTVGHYVFENCTKLESFTFPKSVTKLEGTSTFKNCTALTTVIGFENLPITTVPNDMFRACTSLSSVTIPSTVTKIGITAFTDCKALTSINLPSGLTKIDADASWTAGAFTNCTSLKSITIPASLTELCGKTFQSCTALETVIFEERNGVAITFSGDATFERCKSLKELIIPEGVTALSNCFASECEGLQKVVLPSTLTTLNGSRHFYHAGNSSATGSIEIIGLENTQLTHISTDCFRQNRNWKVDELRLPNTCTTIYDYAFADASIGTFYIGANVTTIGNGALGYNSSLKVMYLPSTVTSIHASAFYSNANAIYVVVGVDDASAAVLTTIETAVSSGKEFIAYDDYFADPTSYTGKNVVYGGNVCEIFYKNVHVFTSTDCIADCTREGCGLTGLVNKDGIHTEGYLLSSSNEADEKISYTAMMYRICQCSTCKTVSSYEEIGILFTLKGYSNATGAIMQGFGVNKEAIEKYNSYAENDIKYGILAANGALGTLNIGTSFVNGVISVDFTNRSYDIMEMKIYGITSATQDTLLYCCGYVEVDGGIIYMDEKMASDATLPTAVSYAGLGGTFAQTASLDAVVPTKEEVLA